LFQKKVSCPFSAFLGFFPLEDKDGLALWGQADAEKCVLKVQADKELCLSWDKAQEHVGAWDHGV
jgi:hypothetical protein